MVDTEKQPFGALPKQPSGRAADASDEELLARFRAGEDAAFEEIFRRWRGRIYRVILRFLRDRHATEDAVQDLFLKVVSAPERFEARSRFSTWLHAVARNLCIDLLRKQRYRRCASLDMPARESPNGGPGVALSEQVPCSQPSPETQAGRNIERLRLLSAIARLADEQRVVFLLRETAGLSFQEIAAIMRAPLNTTKSRMRYALINLRRILYRIP